MAKIIILGAGISGLAAAEQLSKQGHLVTIIEARNRIGGRIDSQTTQHGFPVDMGAMYVHGIGKGFGQGAEQDVENPIAVLLKQTKKNSLMAVDDEKVDIFDSAGNEYNLLKKLWYLIPYYKKSSELFDKVISEAFQKQFDITNENQRNILKKISDLNDQIEQSYSRSLKILSDKENAESQASKDKQDNETLLRDKLNAEILQLNKQLKETSEIFSTLQQAFDYRTDNIPKVDSEAFWIRKMVTMTATNNSGSPLRELSILNYFNRSGYNGGDHIVVGGYVEILNSIFQEANKTGYLKLLLNTSVVSVSYGKDHMAYVTTADGAKFEADVVLSTLPLGVLKAGLVEFSPALSLEKRAAIQNLGMGLQNKVMLEFEKPFWSKDNHYIIPASSEIDFWPEYLNLYHFSGKKTATLIASFYGDHAQFSKLDEKEIAEKALLPLKKSYGKKFQSPVKVTITRWDSDPCALGSWTTLGKKSTLSDLEHIAAPEGMNLFFAGEHTGKALIGTVHAAYKTGLRAANEIASYLKTRLTSRGSADDTAEIGMERKITAEASSDVDLTLSNGGSAIPETLTGFQLHNNKTKDSLDATKDKTTEKKSEGLIKQP